MRTSVPLFLNQNRIRGGPYGTHDSAGMTGSFKLIGPSGIPLFALSSGVDDGTTWEHVSVSSKNRCPNWPEMCFIKDLFWTEDECVIQYHPPKAEYVNYHPYCLHLWKNTETPFPMPPSLLVGPGPG